MCYVLVPAGAAGCGHVPVSRCRRLLTLRHSVTRHAALVTWRTSHITGCCALTATDRNNIIPSCSQRFSGEWQDAKLHLTEAPLNRFNLSRYSKWGWQVVSCIFDVLCQVLRRDFNCLNITLKNHLNRNMGLWNHAWWLSDPCEIVKC